MNNLIVKVEIFGTGSYCINASRPLEISNPQDTEELRKLMYEKWRQYRLDKEKNGKR